jgi:hypothetical protein
MKISIGSKIVEGPWGGGNLFVKNITRFLESNGHEVIFDLSDADIDLILLTDPRSRKESSSTFNHIDIQKYKKYVNKNVAVVQRINECDERKNTSGTNEIYLTASNTADHVIFVSTWLKNLYVNLGLENNKSSVILAGSNKEIFNPSNSAVLTNQKVKIVTHHWSSHVNKGFKIYDQLDKMLLNEAWRERIEFTYIGNPSSDYKLSNSKFIPPLAGKELADELKRHHLYITASLNEPSGNHHIEAAQCGLPILFLDSGGIPEYCEGFGVSFTLDFEEKLDYIIKNYTKFKKNMKNYPFHSEKMCKEFLEKFNEVVNSKGNHTRNKLNLSSYMFLLKNKFLKNARRDWIIKLKKFIKSIIKK